MPSWLDDKYDDDDDDDDDDDNNNNNNNNNNNCRIYTQNRISYITVDLGYNDLGYNVIYSVAPNYFP